MKNRETQLFHHKNLNKSHSAETPQGVLYADKTFGGLTKIEGGFDENQKSRIAPKKPLSFKKSSDRAQSFRYSATSAAPLIKRNLPWI